MKILALEPYLGASHKLFLDGWISNSSHDWTVLSLEPYKWKWRMRHSAITFAQQTNDLISKGYQPDCIFCTDMLNLAEYLGLTDSLIKNTPSIAYFHENQLTYPVRFESERDYQFAMTNLTTALAATEVWFNSDFHRSSFLTALEKFLKRMPDHQPMGAIETILNKSAIHYPGISEPEESQKKIKKNPAILWAARWEHDKNPEDFFAALKVVKSRNPNFRLNVIGESFREIPEVFTWAKEYFKDHIDRWGYQSSIEDYYRTLADSDIVVSTANHEFFGISVIEAVAAGCYPLLPKRLSYPELFQLNENSENKRYFYDDSPESLAEKLMEIISTPAKMHSETLPDMKQFYFPNLAPSLDRALGKTVKDRL